MTIDETPADQPTPTRPPTPRDPLAWLEEVDAARPASPPPPPAPAGEYGQVEARPQATALLEQRLADTEQRRMAAEVRIRVLEEERAKMIAEARDRLGLTRRIERLRNELRRQRDEREGVERELSESRFRIVEQESSLGQLRQAEEQRDALAEVIDLVAERFEEVIDGTRPITRSGLRSLVEAMRLTPHKAVDAVKREVAE